MTRPCESSFRRPLEAVHCGNKETMIRLREQAAFFRGLRRGASLPWGLLLVASAFLLSCSGESGEEPRDRPGLPAGQACTLSSECRADLVCDRSRRICVCTSHEACPGETFCHPYTGRCVSELPGCEVDDDCPDGQFCDPEERACRHGAAYCEPCERDGQCAERGARCLPGGFCGKPCEHERDCEERSRCLGGQCTPSLRCYETDGRPTGRCVDPCARDEDCLGEGERCELGLCLPPLLCNERRSCVPDTLRPCERDADCIHGVDQVCELGQCVARRSGCAFSEACDPLKLTCVPSCTEDADCRPGRVCRSGACFPRYRCHQERHGDCPRGMVCACPKGKSCSTPGEGECVPECRSDADCPLRQVCSESFGRRLCRPGCASERDCGPGERCDQGHCVRDPESCEVTELCPTCSFCEEGSCVAASAPFCARCEGDSECGPGGVCSQGFCAPACGATGCPSGFGCARAQNMEGEFRAVCLPLDGVCDTECT